MCGHDEKWEELAMKFAAEAQVLLWLRDLHTTPNYQFRPYSPTKGWQKVWNYNRIQKEVDDWLYSDVNTWETWTKKGWWWGDIHPNRSKYFIRSRWSPWITRDVTKEEYDFMIKRFSGFDWDFVVTDESIPDFFQRAYKGSWVEQNELQDIYNGIDWSKAGNEKVIESYWRIGMGTRKVTFKESVGQEPYHLQCSNCSGNFQYCSIVEMGTALGDKNKGVHLEFPNFCPKCGGKRETPTDRAVQSVVGILNQGIVLTREQADEILKIVNTRTRV